MGVCVCVEGGGGGGAIVFFFKIQKQGGDY